MILDAVTAAEEDNDFLFEIPFEEREEEKESLVAVTDNIALL
jgi:hypothetical protein